MVNIKISGSLIFAGFLMLVPMKEVKAICPGPGGDWDISISDSCSYSPSLSLNSLTVHGSGVNFTLKVGEMNISGVGNPGVSGVDVNGGAALELDVNELYIKDISDGRAISVDNYSKIKVKGVNSFSVNKPGGTVIYIGNGSEATFGDVYVSDLNNTGIVGIEVVDSKFDILGYGSTNVSTDGRSINIKANNGKISSFETNGSVSATSKAAGASAIDIDGAGASMHVGSMQAYTKGDNSDVLKINQGKFAVDNFLNLQAEGAASLSNGSCDVGAGICMTGNDASFSGLAGGAVTSNGYAILMVAGNGMQLKLNRLSLGTTSDNFHVLAVMDVKGASSIVFNNIFLSEYSAGKGLVFDDSEVEFQAKSSTLYTNIDNKNSSKVVAKLEGSELHGTISSNPGNSFDLSLDATSQWWVMRSSVLQKLNNAGAVYFNDEYYPTTSFKTLQVDDYVGYGGSLNVDTYLGNSASPSDKLVATTVSGSTLVYVTRRGGLGAEITGKGIQVVEVLGSSTATAFKLGHTVSAGAYEYHLYQNIDKSWYLTTNLPVTPTQPDYSDEAYTVAVLPALAQYYGMSTLGSWRERVGSMKFSQSLQNNKFEIDESPFWGRVGMERGTHDGGFEFKPEWDSKAFTPHYKYKTNFLQLGADFYRNKKNEIYHAAGAFFTIGSIQGDVNSFYEFNGVLQQATSKAKIDNFGVGAYFNQLMPTGLYVDLIGQYIHHDLTAQAASDRLKANGHSWMLSAEMGKSYAINSSWAWMPQAHLRWQNVNFGVQEAWASGVNVGEYVFGSNDALQARLGLEVRYQSWEKNGAWIRMDVLREFKGDNRVQYRPAAISAPERPEFMSSRKGTSMELLAGMDMPVGHNLSMYGSAGYRYGLSNRNKGDAWNASLGVRWGW